MMLVLPSLLRTQKTLQTPEG